jgi:hypothetical protein
VLPAAFLVVLAVGVGLGILVDRRWLRPTAADTRPAQDPRLVGRWVSDEDKTPLEFRTDGTFEYGRVTTFDVPAFGPRPEDVRTEKKTRVDVTTGQYRWVDGETVQVTEPNLGGAWLTSRVVIEGERLTLLGKDGTVRRYTRAP